MNAITIFFSIAALWSLISFNREGRKLKITYGLVAYGLVLLFGIQAICLSLLGCKANIVQMLMTIAFSIPIVSCHGNVSDVCKELKQLINRTKDEIRR